MKKCDGFTLGSERFERSLWITVDIRLDLIPGGVEDTCSPTSPNGEVLGGHLDTECSDEEEVDEDSPAEHVRHPDRG